jgi:hypothetical protein
MSESAASQEDASIKDGDSSSVNDEPYGNFTAVNLNRKEESAPRRRWLDQQEALLPLLARV